jgi:LemA protein
MKRILTAVLGLFIALSFSSCGYNSLVNLEENVKGKWAQETLTQVIEARAKATSVTVDPSNLSPEAIQEFQKSQDALSQSLGRLLVSVERYPELKANQNFLELQAQLEGTENRISTERRAFNEATQEYNSSVRRFPNNITAGIFGFKQKGYFTAEAGANTAPKVEF